ncbi:MAG: polysaccharide biosynthesis/export family protein [Desulfobaccales bacterium]
MWTSVGIGVLALSLLSGCAAGPEGALSPSGKYMVQNGKWVSAPQAPPKGQAAAPSQGLRDQVVVQDSETPLPDYKDYQVGPEDQLDIVVYGQDALNRTLRVNGQGEIVMPMVGPVKVAGLTAQEIERRLMELYDAHYLVNPQITVAVKEYRHQRVAVTGAVNKPGSYEIIGPRSLLEVLSMAGGISNQGQPTGGGAQAGDVVDVIRHQNAPDQAKTAKAGALRPFAQKTETMVIDLRRLVSGQEPRLNIPVGSGDMVYVPFAGTAYVLGAVKKPGLIVVKENLTVSQAIAQAGDADIMLASNDIAIMRFDDQGRPITINTNLTKIIARAEPDIPIKDNDVIVAKASVIKKTLYVFKNMLPVSGGYSLAPAF